MSSWDPPSDVPGGAHGLVGQPVGLVIADKDLLFRVETERPAQLDCDLPEIDQRAGAMAVPLVQGKTAPLPHRLGEVRDLGLRVGKPGHDVLEVRDVGFEPAEELALRPLEEGRVLVAVLAVEDEGAPVGVLHLDPAPGAAGVGVLLGAVERGLGGCMFGNVDRDQLRKSLRIEEQYEILQVIALGKPREVVRLVPMGGDGDIRYYRDADGVHYVPKRSLEEIILA